MVRTVEMLKGSILKKLVDSHGQGKTSKTPLNYGVYYKNTLIALCHALEDSILESECQPVIVAAFQRGKWYLQEAERYNDLAEKSRDIAILATAEAGFADRTASENDNVSFVALSPDDPVAQEWHLMILSPNYTAMVMCQELLPEDYGAEGVPEVDVERKFYGFWTFEPELVIEAVRLSIEHIGKYDEAVRERLSVQVKEIEGETQVDRTEDLSGIVSRVVDYLKTSHGDLEKQVDSTPFPHQTQLERNIVSNKLQAFLRMAQLIDLTDTENPMAATEVSSLCEMMGQLLDLQAWQLKRLRLAGLLHRLDYLPGSNSEKLSAHNEEAPSCPLRTGAQVLRTMPQLRAVAKIVTHQTECWDGSGQPAGLSYDGIPVESRILGLLAYFQGRVTQLSRHHSREEALSMAMSECQGGSGSRWDPKLVETLALLVLGMQQGMTLPQETFKISSGMWLLDHHPDESEVMG
ncbi:DICT sensory domain-containing protein [Baaleninema sp.]|uniref:DICT sensory domain-containing protein n=1 Tax=Baaleninema sp. TaxID=3101197 RepID=UPI003CFE163E